MLPEADPELGLIYSNLDYDTRMLVNLWRACVTQAIRDLAIQEYRPDGTLDEERCENKLDAAQWFWSEDYEVVAEYALINAKILRDEVLGIIAIAEPYRRMAVHALADRINAQTLHVIIADTED